MTAWNESNFQKEYAKYHRVPFECICVVRGSVAAGDTGKVAPGGKEFFPGEGLIPCRFLWVYQILALLRAISRGFLYAFFLSRRSGSEDGSGRNGVSAYSWSWCLKWRLITSKYHRVPFERFQIYLDGSPWLRGKRVTVV